MPDHPRIRGEHRKQLNQTLYEVGSSPHTRGAPLVSYQERYGERIIPAYAGSTFDSEFLWGPGTDHPRIRGEHSSSAPSGHGATGSSPHTRGAPTMAALVVAAVMDHPRIRGEHRRTIRDADGAEGSSPHTRGARAGYGARQLPGIIPAYAGSTVGRNGGRTKNVGSSPHTRGALSRETSFLYVQRIIPAYAGSTSSAIMSSRVREDHPRIRGEH